jgi:hypothetical protein
MPGGEALHTTVGGVYDNSRPQQRRAITMVRAGQAVFMPLRTAREAAVGAAACDPPAQRGDDTLGT